MAQQSGGALLLRRCIDLVAAGLGLLLLSPLLLLIALALFLSQGPPVFFRHVRAGLHGKLFTLIKFRTMRPLRPGELPYVTDRHRVTALGQFLRLTSLDELPELL